MQNPTKQLMQFVQDTTYADIPENVIALAKKHLIDCVGSALAEAAIPRSRIVQRYFDDIHTTGPCRVIGTGRKTTLDNVAFANGILAHTICFDDSGPSHPSATVVPGLLAMCEQYEISGKEALTAQVLAYDVFQRLNAVTEDAWEMRVRGWHPTGFFGTVTGAAQASKLMGLTLEQAVNAVGIAATTGGGLSQNIGSMGMGLHAGNASRNGVVAAHLAKWGFRVDPCPLEGKFGLMDALCGPGQYDISVMVEDLGKPFRLYEPGITIKPYPNCWAHHKVYDAVLQLIGRYKIKADQVESVLVDLQPDKPTYRYLEPKTDLEARYSLAYGIAVALMDGEITLKQYEESRVRDPETAKMLRKIKHAPQKRGDDINAVTIVMKDTSRYTNQVAYSKGHPQKNPMSDKEVEEKYRMLASMLLPASRVEQSFKMMQDLESVGDMHALIDSLIP